MPSQASLIENAKVEGRYRYAGQLAALYGYDRSYGVHYGLKSLADAARELYHMGYNEVSFYLCNGDTKRGN
jgi:hypothetical protein